MHQHLERWSLITLQEKVVKIGAKVIAHACRVSKSMTGLTKPMHGQRRHDGAHDQGEELVGLGRAGLHE